MIRLKEYKLENIKGLNRTLAKNTIMNFYQRTNNSSYNGTNYIIIIRRNKEFGFMGFLISKITKKKYKFKYNYMSNNFEIN